MTSPDHPRSSGGEGVPVCAHGVYLHGDCAECLKAEASRLREEVDALAERTPYKLFPPAAKPNDDTEIAYIEGWPFINARKHEAVCDSHVARAEAAEQARDHYKAEAERLREALANVGRYLAASDDEADRNVAQEIEVVLATFGGGG